MVNIKGLDKMRVLRALYDNSEKGYGEFLRIAPDLSGDEFDERLYDRDCGEGAAQRAVDSIRDEQEDGGDTAGNADGEKKEPSLEEQAEMTKKAVHKILDILQELPPTSRAIASIALKMALSGPEMGGMLMMGRPLIPSVGGTFGMGVYGPITDDPDLLGRIKRRFG